MKYQFVTLLYCILLLLTSGEEMKKSTEKVGIKAEREAIHVLRVVLGRVPGCVCVFPISVNLHLLHS